MPTIENLRKADKHHDFNLFRPFLSLVSAKNFLPPMNRLGCACLGQKTIWPKRLSGRNTAISLSHLNPKPHWKEEDLRFQQSKVLWKKELRSSGFFNQFAFFHICDVIPKGLSETKGSQIPPEVKTISSKKRSTASTIG